MENAQIYEAITNAMNEIAPIAKRSRNTQQGFAYRGIDDVMNEIQPILIKNNIFIVPEVLEHLREERQTKSGGNLIYSVLKIKYTFFSKDGSSVCAIVIGEGMDSGDKASNKALAIGLKYALLQTFCIPTADVKDPDHDTPPPSTPKQPQPQAAPPKPQNPQQEADRKTLTELRRLLHETGVFHQSEIEIFETQAREAWKAGGEQRRMRLDALLMEVQDKIEKSTPHNDELPL